MVIVLSPRDGSLIFAIIRVHEHSRAPHFSTLDSQISILKSWFSCLQHDHLFLHNSRTQLQELSQDCQLTFEWSVHIPVQQKEIQLTNDQALCDVVWYPLNISCYTNVASTLLCFELFSSKCFSFTIPHDVRNRVPTNWAGKCMFNTSSHSSILYHIINFWRILKEWNKIKSKWTGGIGRQWWGIKVNEIHPYKQINTGITNEERRTSQEYWAFSQINVKCYSMFKRDLKEISFIYLLTAL